MGSEPTTAIAKSRAIGVNPYRRTASAEAISRAAAPSEIWLDTAADLDVVEINEAFAPVVLAWQKETGVDPERVNPCGGAIALGHPLGASGARLMTTLVHRLRRTGGRYGLQTMCEGGGMANATVVERL